MERRLKHEPLQYLLGNWYFRDLDIKVQKPVLIPRIETEQIIDIIKEQLHIKQIKQFSFLEVGIGTGCISISLVKDNLKNVESFIGIDINPQCVNLSRINLQKNLKYEFNRNLINQTQLKQLGQFQNKSFDQFLIDYIQDKEHKFNFIVSNPPYISVEDYNKLDKSVRN
ncbi:hypothetical protein PPERSA_06762 [Pseudocohnilembus persalinus]|uniref:Type II methyltransferase M.TaqI-like domain-containing protein n=1 Tax=Pseudocohnilembus persalinus TaxID=266149 RepID=A0A0V0QT92_PSEPJ|nr:hypothetical protein PPERSA_06762 [Pseudocohnilembus persalinus]|eukprot:KRX05128.1 hypothetical protein PPERSA_06762 [Pseudocohnilembus persalinus]